MSGDSSGTVTRRRALRVAGTAFAAGVGAVGSASASHCTEDNCVETTTEAEVYDSCGASTSADTVYEGKSGFVWDTCTDDVKYALVAFNCREEWWVKCEDLQSSVGCMC